MSGGLRLLKQVLLRMNSDALGSGQIKQVYCRHSRRRPSRVVYVSDAGS